MSFQVINQVASQTIAQMAAQVIALFIAQVTIHESRRKEF